MNLVQLESYWKAANIQGLDVRALYYITHKDNLLSILEHGIFCSDRVEGEKLHRIPTYNGNVVDQRNYKTADGKELWFYANLYFQPRNAMMYRIIHQQDLKNLAVIGIDQEVLREYPIQPEHLKESHLLSL